MSRIVKFPLAAAAIAVAVAACSSGTSSTSAAPSAASTTSSTASASSSATSADAIKIQGFKFGDPVTVKPGATVTVTNQDAVPHNVVSDTAGMFKTTAIQQGESTTFTAPTAPGTYKFSCTFHPKMKGIGTLVVQG